jgi:hypothetical protein
LAEEKEPTDPEEIADALARMDIDIEDTATQEDFIGALEEALGYTPTEAQVQAFTKTQFELIPQLEFQGIRAIQIEYPWGKQIRYAWEEHPGLWGFETISLFLETL